MDRAPSAETSSTPIPENDTMTDATAETPITREALDELFNAAADVILLAQDLRSKIEAMRRQLAPTGADETTVDEPQAVRLHFG
jgi:hypothetical protein